MKALESIPRPFLDSVGLLRPIGSKMREISNEASKNYKFKISSRPFEDSGRSTLQ